MKKILNINDEWLFIEEYDENTQVPIEELEYDETVILPYVFGSPETVSVFKKTIKVNADYKKLFLEIKEGSGTTEVYLNSHLLGSHYGSNTCFRFNITDSFNANEDNEIIIKSFNIDNNFGLLGDINLILTDEIHFDLMDDGSCGIYILPSPQGLDADIKISTLISGKISHASTEYSIYDPKQQQVCILQQPAFSHDFVYTLSNVCLWNIDELMHPNLYTLKAKIFSTETNEVFDETQVAFGIRSFAFEENEFTLNSNPLQLKSITLSHNAEHFKDKLSYVYQNDIDHIQAIGANLVRFTNNHFSNSFYTLCNQEGILVNHDLTFLPTDIDDGETKKNIRTYIIELIKQNYNHPSLCFWSLEDSIIENLDLQELFYKQLLNLIKRMDKERISSEIKREIIADAGFLYDKTKDNNLIKGLVSLANQKNDKYYYYRMLWKGKKIVHICREEISKHTTSALINLKVYSTCGKLCVFVNGEHFTDLTEEKYAYEIDIPLVIGENRITVNSEHDCGDTITITRAEID